MANTTSPSSFYGTEDTGDGSGNTAAPSSFYNGNATDSEQTGAASNSQQEPALFAGSVAISSFTPIPSNWLNGLTAEGAFTYSQPSFTDISGVAFAAQLPAATTSALGAVKPDNKTLSVTGGVLSFNAPVISNFSLANTNVSCPTANTIQMFGFGSTLKYTPSRTGVVMVFGLGFSTPASGAANGDRIRSYLYFGTGTAPSNGAAATGTQYGLMQAFVYETTALPQMSVNTMAIVQLTPGTAYWFDIGGDDGTTNTVTLSFNSGVFAIIEC